MSGDHSIRLRIATVGKKNAGIVLLLDGEIIAEGIITRENAIALVTLRPTFDLTVTEQVEKALKLKLPKET